ncbi:hypothetical protein V8F20_002808 [Naviculisporaceae sp. PSN 640]
MKLATILTVLVTSIAQVALAAPMVTDADTGVISVIAARDGTTELDPDLCPFKKTKRRIKAAPGEGGSCPVQN